VKTLREIEAAICEGVRRFEQDYMGRGPKDIYTHLLDDFLVVRLKGVLPDRSPKEVALSTLCASES